MAKSTLPPGITARRDGAGRLRYDVKRTYRWGNRRRTLRRTADTLREARVLLGELDREVRAVRRGERRPDAPRTFEGLAAEFERERLVEARYDAKGLKIEGYRHAGQYRTHVAAIRDHFGPAVGLREVTPAEIRRFALALADTPVAFRARTRVRSCSTVRRYLATLSTIFSYAVECGYLGRDENPMIRLTLPPAFSKEAEQPRTRILTLEEERRLLAACEAPDRRHLRPILVAALDTGRRLGELLGLRWRHVDLDRRVLLIERRLTKTRVRPVDLVPFGARLAAVLETLRPRSLAEAGDRAVFTYVPRGEERPRPVRSVKRAFATACREAGIEGVRFHDLRHTHGSRLHAAGVPGKVIQERLGHTRFETTARFYLNSDAESLDRAVDAIDRLTAAVETTPEEVN